MLSLINFCHNNIVSMHFVSEVYYVLIQSSGSDLELGCGDARVIQQLVFLMKTIKITVVIL